MRVGTLQVFLENLDPVMQVKVEIDGSEYDLNSIEVVELKAHELLYTENQGNTHRIRLRSH